MNVILPSRVRAWILRGNHYFSADWRVLPFQPFLYTFIFLGAMLAVSIDVHHPSFGQDATFSWWITLSMLCPPMALIAWILIRRFPGRPRYFGFWLRLGADLGQLGSVSAFLAAIAPTIDPIAAEIYASEIFTAVWFFIWALIIRDAWKLVLTERIATDIRNECA